MSSNGDEILKLIQGLWSLMFFERWDHLADKLPVVVEYRKNHYKNLSAVDRLEFDLSVDTLFSQAVRFTKNKEDVNLRISKQAWKYWKYKSSVKLREQVVPLYM